ncbi:hypothetical protein HJG60_010993 [Phyllostomus discolor]|uniref:Uncharacterized protein n=1 Tax=Phyllostomus discolor TaxID=89673 RepID=A0A834AHU9_9CHIR|nr:hypothetical protein HJG60_010993 [Phyllostomus discolor]
MRKQTSRSYSCSSAGSEFKHELLTATQSCSVSHRNRGPGPAAHGDGPRDPSARPSSAGLEWADPGALPAAAAPAVLPGFEPATRVAWLPGSSHHCLQISPVEELRTLTGTPPWGLDLLRRDTVSASSCLSFLVTQHPGRTEDGGSARAPPPTVPFCLGLWPLSGLGSLRALREAGVDVLGTPVVGCGIQVCLPYLPCDHGWVPSPLLAAHHCKMVPILGLFKLGHLRDFEFMILGVPHPEGAFNRSGAPRPGRCPRTVVLPLSGEDTLGSFVCAVRPLVAILEHSSSRPRSPSPLCRVGVGLARRN